MCATTSPPLQADATAADAIARENATAAAAAHGGGGDLVVLPCAENHHRGKTLYWYAHVHAGRVWPDDGLVSVPRGAERRRRRRAGRVEDDDGLVSGPRGAEVDDDDDDDGDGGARRNPFDFVAKMDSDACVVVLERALAGHLDHPVRSLSPSSSLVRSLGLWFSSSLVRRPTRALPCATTHTRGARSFPRALARWARRSMGARAL